MYGLTHSWGRYGRVQGVLEPLPEDQLDKLLFADETVGNNIPKNFVPSIEKGYIEACIKGPVTGHAVTGVKFRLTDGTVPCDRAGLDWSFFPRLVHRPGLTNVLARNRHGARGRLERNGLPRGRQRRDARGGACR